MLAQPSLPDAESEGQRARGNWQNTQPSVYNVGFCLSGTKVRRLWGLRSGSAHSAVNARLRWQVGVHGALGAVVGLESFFVLAMPFALLGTKSNASSPSCPEHERLRPSVAYPHAIAQDGGFQARAILQPSLRRHCGPKHS